jgi:tetratricopeptide (TPR) repeat protein
MSEDSAPTDAPVADWPATYAALSGVLEAEAPDLDDLELYGTAAYLIGNVHDSIGALQRAYQLHADGGDVVRAARCAFWLIFHHVTGRDFGQAEGWIARAGRMVEEADEPGAAAGYMLLPRGFRQAALIHDYAGACETAARAADIGRRCGDRDLVALALNIEGRSWLGQGRVREGLAALDEAMVAVVGGEVSVPVAGAVYCSVIDACDEISEFRRAHEWTNALSEWRERQLGLVAFAGQCLVHRATVRQLRGEWQQARDEAEAACERLANAPDRYATGGARYRLGELLRCQGDDDAAESAFRQAGEWGYDPQPGLALLRLAQGRTEAAVAALTRALDETDEAARRGKLLPGFVEAVLSAGDTDAARRAADELDGVAALYGTTALAAEAGLARGTVLLATGDPRAGLVALRHAVNLWRELDDPYD